MKTVKLTPKVSQELKDIWHYGYEHFGKGLLDIYIN
ncbi:type II toxin-antitoxin system RelE/ParE family toxin [Escherichia coli]|nr:type II toxin-antitoxin system RelE/ParE family toxin [Escherichia coli]EEW7548804.1 type II toxin-antitoxin system RelE/ParE family toxin [Escherichia coli]EFB2359586.1 type II toxin-antitoxin system RelE/ParE family toxin [Escherichia coli]EFB9664815.1 type II toxin-antitoxin system RelE/ParE family toxin [Escherichia coli]